MKTIGTFRPYEPDLSPLERPENWRNTPEGYEWREQQAKRNRLADLIYLGQPMLADESGNNWFDVTGSLVPNHYALVLDGQVVSVSVEPTAFPPIPNATLLAEVPEDVGIGWLWDGTTFMPPQV